MAILFLGPTLDPSLLSFPLPFPSFFTRGVPGLLCLLSLHISPVSLSRVSSSGDFRIYQLRDVHLATTAEFGADQSSVRQFFQPCMVYHSPHVNETIELLGIDFR